MKKENNPSRKVVNLLHFSNLVFAGSLNKRFIPHSHGTIDFMVGCIGIVIFSLIITTAMIRCLPKLAVVIAIPVILILSVISDII